MGVGKDQAHFLDGVSIRAEYSEGEHTFANCNNFELGSREVVMTIFGSWIPALEYSLSMCVEGSARFPQLAFSTSDIKTHLPAPRHTLGPSPCSSHPSSARWEAVSRLRAHPSAAACAHRSDAPVLPGIWRRHIAASRVLVA